MKIITQLVLVCASGFISMGVFFGIILTIGYCIYNLFASI